MHCVRTQTLALGYISLYIFLDQSVVNYVRPSPSLSLSHKQSIDHVHRAETSNPACPSWFAYHISTARSHARTHSAKAISLPHFFVHIYHSLGMSWLVCTCPLILVFITLLLALPPACNSEQAAATVLGYDEVSWDNESGRERQPWQSKMIWASMTMPQRRAVMLLGFTQATWDGRADASVRPASYSKKWSELTTTCGE